LASPILLFIRSKKLTTNYFYWVSFDGQSVCYCNIWIIDDQGDNIYDITEATPQDQMTKLTNLGYLFCPSESAKLLQLFTDNTITEYTIV
jgi:hypothetical protein